MSDLPAPVSAFFRAIRRAVKRFEVERREEPPYSAKWEFTAILRRDDLDGGWVAECVDLPGCLSQGETEEEALENLADAIGGVIGTRMHDQVREQLPHATESDHEHKIAISV